jgi:hypothetical protein
MTEEDAKTIAEIDARHAAINAPDRFRPTDEQRAHENITAFEDRGALLAIVKRQRECETRTFHRLCRARSALSHCRQACEGDDNDLTREIRTTVDRALEDTREPK